MGFRNLKVAATFPMTYYLSLITCLPLSLHFKVYPTLFYWTSSNKLKKGGLCFRLLSPSPPSPPLKGGEISN